MGCVFLRRGRNGSGKRGFWYREVWENHWATAHREVGMVACSFFYPVLMSVFIVVVVGSPDALSVRVLSGGFVGCVLLLLSAVCLVGGG